MLRSVKPRNILGLAGAGLIAFLAVPAVSAGAAASHWTIQPSPDHLPGENLLYGVSCASPNVCDAVGGWFTRQQVPFLLAEGWNGKTWTLQAVPKPNGAAFALFYAVSCPTPKDCVAVGDDSDGMVGAQWNGHRWSIQPQTFPKGAYFSLLRGVSCLSATLCTAVGWYSQVVNHTLKYFSLAARWNGTAWSIPPTPNPVGSKGTQLYGVSCTSATSCIAVGSYEDKAQSVSALSEAWNGTNWSIQTIPAPKGSAGTALYGVSCTAPSACTAVGDGPGGYALVEAYHRSWRVQKSPSPSPGIDYLAGVSCPSPSVCLAAGDAQESATSASPFAEQRSGPARWSVEQTPTPPGAQETLLESISCSSDTACTAVGYDGAGATLVERYSG